MNINLRGKLNLTKAVLPSIKYGKGAINIKY